MNDTITCPNCDATMKRDGINEWDTLYLCPVCGEELDTSYDPLDDMAWVEPVSAAVIDPPMPLHPSFILEVDGVSAHVQGDPDMPPETMTAIERMIRAAIQQAQKDDDTL